MELRIKTLTPLWTGGVETGKVDRLHETGLLGSLRWWYEALVRGLGGYACDPTSEDRCPDKDGKHCVACELFGCTGWARKFRLEALTTPKIEKRAIVAGQSLEIAIIPSRNMDDEEWCLLHAVFRLISEYGAIGGKTIFKPSDEQGRQALFHHQDFGLVEIKTSQGGWRCSKTLEEIKTYVNSGGWRTGTHRYRDKQGREHDYSWASLQNFWCVKGRYLARQTAQQSTYNQVLGRRQPKQQGQSLANNNQSSQWLAGSQQDSKKVFSFKHSSERRTFGFIKLGLLGFDEMKKRLKQVWPDFDPSKEFLTGDQVLRSIFPPQGGVA